MENNVKFSVSSSYFMFVLWFIYSRLNGVSEALVRCVRVAKRKTHQKLHNFGDIIFFFLLLLLTAISQFRFLSSEQNQADRQFYGFRMDANRVRYGVFLRI